MFPLMAGSLAEAVHEHGWRPQGAWLVRIAKALAEGLAAIHTHGIIHRYLKGPTSYQERPCYTSARELVALI